MGLFDHIYDQHGARWQTKSFTKPNMDHYRVTSTGRLEKLNPPDGETSSSASHRYSDDYGELYASIRQRIEDEGNRSTWAKHEFSGVVQALSDDEDGKLHETEFAFESGILIGINGSETG